MRATRRFAKAYKVFLHYQVAATPKKIVAHTLMHEIRHWAQLATICRMNGYRADADDLLICPLLGGEFNR